MDFQSTGELQDPKQAQQFTKPELNDLEGICTTEEQLGTSCFEVKGKKAC